MHMSCAVRMMACGLDLENINQCCSDYCNRKAKKNKQKPTHKVAGKAIKKKPEESRGKKRNEKKKEKAKGRQVKN